jgi:hypothetical protein
MGGGPFFSQVNPAIEVILHIHNIAGKYKVPLSVNQMPNHTHWNNSRKGEHNHSFINYIQSGNSGSGGEAAGYFKLQILEMQVFILTI